jgi:hypothetical protein
MFLRNFWSLMAAAASVSVMVGTVSAPASAESVERDWNNSRKVIGNRAFNFNTGGQPLRRRPRHLNQPCAP